MNQICEAVSRNIAPFISGNLDAQKSSAVLKHLRTCEKCQRTLSGFRRVWEVLDGWEDVEPPDSLVLKYPRRRPELLPLRRLFKLAAATVITVGVLACIFFIFVVGVWEGARSSTRGLLLLAGEPLEIKSGRRLERRIGRHSAITISGPAKLACKQATGDAVLTLQLGTIDVTKERSLTSLTVEIPNGVVRAEEASEFRVAVHEPRAQERAHLRLLNIEAATLIRVYSGRVSVENFFAGTESVEEGESHIVTLFGNRGRVEGILKGEITDKKTEEELLWGARVDIPELGHAYFLFPEKTVSDLRIETVRLGYGQPVSMEYERAGGKLWVRTMRKLDRSPRAVFLTDVFSHPGEAEIGHADARRISAVLGPLDRASEWSDFVVIVASEQDKVNKLQFAVRVLADRLDQDEASYEATKAIRTAVKNLEKPSVPADLYPTLYRTLELRNDPGAWIETLKLLAELRDQHALRRIRSAMRRLKERSTYPRRIHRCIAGKWRQQEYDLESTRTAVVKAANRAR